MSDESEKCPTCGAPLESDAFNGVVRFGRYCFDVYVTACRECGYIDGERSWVE